MELSIFNFLAPASVQAASSTADNAPADVAFADLLSTDVLAGGQQGQQQNGDLGRELAANALIAQEIGVPETPVAATGLSPLHHGAIAGKAALRAEDIDVLKAHVNSDAPSKDENAPEHQLLQELSAELEQLDMHTELPSAEDLVEQLPSVAQQKDPSLRSEIASRVLQFIQTTLQKTAPESPVKVAVETPVLAKPVHAVAPTHVEAAYAAMFRNEPQASAEQAEIKREEEPAQPDIGVERGSVDLPVVAVPQWVKNIGAPVSTAVSTGEIKTVELPHVNLPKASNASLADDSTSQNSAENTPAIIATLRAIDKAATPAAVTPIVEATQPDEQITVKVKSLKEIQADDETRAAVKATEIAAAAATTPDSGEQNLPAGLQIQSVHDTKPAQHTPATTYTSHGEVAHTRHSPVDQVHVAVKHAADTGMDNITIQLQPYDLGRVEVKMEMQADGTAHLVFTADKAETLDGLQRDVRSLERSLQESGIKADAGSMEFNLRQQAGQQAMNGGNGQNPQHQQPEWQTADAERTAEEAAAAEIAAAETRTENYHYQVNYGLDVRV